MANPMTYTPVSLDAQPTTDYSYLSFQSACSPACRSFGLSRICFIAALLHHVLTLA